MRPPCGDSIDLTFVEGLLSFVQCHEDPVLDHDEVLVAVGMAVQRKRSPFAVYGPALERFVLAPLSKRKT